MYKLTFLEKQTDPTTPMHWRGNMQADYLYPNGVAGDKFFKHLKNNDSFLASKCPKCEKRYFPPRLYCEDCFEEIPGEDWFEVPLTGIVELYTVATLDAHGEKLANPKVMALIKIDETDGRILGTIQTDNPNKEFLTLKVKAVLRPMDQREGTIKDIQHFKVI